MDANEGDRDKQTNRQKYTETVRNSQRKMDANEGGTETNRQTSRQTKIHRDVTNSLRKMDGNEGDRDK